MIKEYFDTAISPLMEGDGGYMAFESEDGDDVTVLVRGECSCCNKLTRCLDWCEKKVLADTGRSIKLHAHILKPYFRDV